MEYKSEDDNSIYNIGIKVLIISLSIVCNLFMNIFYFKSLKLLGSKATLLNFCFNYFLTVKYLIIEFLREDCFRDYYIQNQARL